MTLFQKTCSGSGIVSTAAIGMAIALTAGSVFAQEKTQKKVRTKSAKLSPFQRAMQNAQAEFKKGRYTAALKILQDMKRQYPHASPPEVTMALLHLSVGHRRAAEAALDRAATNDPQDPEAFILLAELSLRDGRLTMAALGYQRGQELLREQKQSTSRLQDLQVRIHAGFASIGEAQGRFETAKRYLALWLSLNPKNPLALGSLGRVNFQLKKYDEARAAFVALEKAEKDAPPADISMGRLYSRSGMPKEARRSMEAAVKSRPKDVRVRLAVAEWALEAGLNDLARANIDAALKSQADSVVGRLLAARLARQTGETAKAISLLQSVLKKTPKDFSVSNELLLAMAASKDAGTRKTALDDAEKAYKLRARRRTAETYQAAITYAWLLFLHKRVQEAEALINFIPNKYPISNESAYYAARVYSSRGNAKQSLAMLKLALSNDMAFPHRGEAEELQKQLSSGEKRVSARN